MMESSEKTSAFHAPLRFRELRLWADGLEALRRFYGGSLNLPIVAEDQHSFTIQAGESRVQFYQAEPGARPTYHFAFLIPENKIDAAAGWLSDRIPLLPHPETGRTITYWEFWDAHSVYFFDPAGNVVELIARHGLQNSGTGAFGPEDFLGLNEVGLPVPDVPRAAMRLRAELDLGAYNACTEPFCALGDAHGLLILVKTGRPWYPTEDHPAGIFRLEATLQRSGPAEVTLPGLPYRIELVQAETLAPQQNGRGRGPG